MNNKIAIVGTQPDTRHLAPFSDPNWDIWVFNEVAGKPTEKMDDGTLRPWAWRVDAVFQMHKPAIYRSKFNRADPNHWEWLQKKHRFPIYMLDIDPLVPSSVKYPLEEVSERFFGKFRQGNPLKNDFKYFTSSIAYAIALACYLDQYDTIGVWGVEMNSNTEYIYQRDCVNFWCGVALGMGKSLDFFSGKDIWERPLYGYDGFTEQKPETYQERVDKLQKEYEGAVDEVQKQERKLNMSWLNGQIADTVPLLANAETKRGIIDGRMHELLKYQKKLIEMRENEGSGYIDRNEFEGSAAHSRGEVEKFSQQVYTTKGYIELALASWLGTRDPATLQKLKEFVAMHNQAAYKSGFHQGVHAMNWELVVETDQAITAAGGSKALNIISAEMDKLKNVELAPTK